MTGALENKQIGPFLVLNKLGNNRRQRVYRARQIEQDKEVALKFIKVPPTIEWHKALDKLDREFSQLQKLRHPNLVKVFGAGVEEKLVFYATELIDGESLSAILSRRGKLAPDQVVEYGRQIAEFLTYLHAKDLIHSKLTPEKILITPDHRVKISDLRLNRAKRRRWDSTRRRELELAAYMAPEQFTEGASEKSDFYALGVMLYEMLSGELPYPPDTMGRMTQNKMNAPVPSVATHVMNCPIWLNKIITQMLDPDPRKRPHSAKAIVLAFEEIKNIDATRQAAVSQMTSGFNPLTAGEDKTEAQALLGKGTRGKTGPPIFQRIWFQALALLIVVTLIVLFSVQEGPRSILSRAETMIASEEPGRWSEAREILGPIMDGDGEYAEEATQLYFLSRQKSLLARAESGRITRMDDESFQQFSKAYNLQREGKDEDAADIYATLVDQLDPAGAKRHIYREAKLRYEELSNQFVWPEDPESLLKMVADTEQAETERELINAQRMLGKMSIRFAGTEGYDGVRAAVEQQLKQIKQQLVDLRTETPPADSAQSE